ncbi:MAG: hypothetical protein QM754_08445 [Tepidisphaeraceae bacterium]
MTLNKWLPFLDWRHHQDYFDFDHYQREISAVPDCLRNVASQGFRRETALNQPRRLVNWSNV